MKRILSTITMLMLFASLNGQVTYKVINNRKLIAPTLDNLIGMYNMPMDSWQKLMGDCGYTLEGIIQGSVQYSSSLGAYVSHVGGQFFYKSLDMKSIEYNYQNIATNNPELRNDFVNFITSITRYYDHTYNGWACYIVNYKGDDYGITFKESVIESNIIHRISITKW
jgi:hypothetical protein